MKIETNYLRAKVSELYCAISLFLLAFVNYNGATSFFDMTVPYIHGHVIIIHFFVAILFLIVFLLFMIGSNYFYVDTIFLCLFLKCLIDAVPFLRNGIDINDYFWHWAITFVSLITYLIIVKSDLRRKDVDVIRWMLMAFSIVLCIQVIYTSLNCGRQYLDILFKIAMVIPYGGSNIIAAALLPLVFLFYYSEMKPLYKWLSISTLIVGIILTKSRGAMLYGLGVFFLVLYSNNRNSKYSAFKRLFLIIAMILLSFSLFSDETFIKIMQGFTLGSSNSRISDSGRIRLWITMINEMANENNWLFGVGMKSLAGHTAGAHSILIDMFYKGGLIGGVNYLVVILTLTKTAILNIKTGEKTFAVIVLILLGNMLFEVNYFSYNCDVFFWIVASLMMNEHYAIIGGRE